jgi:hypothetical protein
MSFWDAQRQNDTAGLVDNMVQIGAHMRENRANTKAEKEYREGYAKALDEAKRTGNMPEQYQQTVAIDNMGRQIGVKVVALRELGKLNPQHPLVASTVVRQNIATQTVKNYSQAGRPLDPDYNQFAPDDGQAQRIYEFTLKP